MRAPRLVLSTLIAGLFLIAPVGAAEVQLRPSIAVDNQTITLGDIFEVAGEAAGVTVAAAPPPGRKIMLRPSYVANMAYRAGLTWRIPTGLRRIVVTRISNLVPSQAIREALEEAVRPFVQADSLEIQLSSRNLEIHVAGDQMPTVAVDDLNYDPRSRRFSARLRAPADDPNGRRIRVMGRVFANQEIPVLARRVGVGDVIRERDITYIPVRTQGLGRLIVTDASDLVGMSPRRMIRTGAAVRSTDLRKPEMVSKGDLATMVLQFDRLRLTAVGRALEGGSKGDTIRIVNAQSYKTVQAVIVGPNRVVIQLPRQLAANLGTRTN